jgi:Flp pilus assembly protein TadD
MSDEIDSTLQEGIAALRENRLDEAEEKFLQLLELDPNSAAATCNLGMLELLRQSPQKGYSLFGQGY